MKLLCTIKLCHQKFFLKTKGAKIMINELIKQGATEGKKE
jgi:hypothetical protein